MSNADDVMAYSLGRIERLKMGDPWAVAMLAKLRRAAGKDVSETPEIWEFTLADLPENLSGYVKDREYMPSDGERAIHVALTLYAIHAQGSQESPDERGISLGAAVNKLVRIAGNNSEPIKRRFSAVATSSDLNELAHHLRGLVQLFKASGNIKMDYPKLAKDLYTFSFPDGRSNIMFHWAEDLFKNVKENDESNETKEVN